MMRYHHIQVKIKSKTKPPYYTGSMIRGAFGYVLKKVVCTKPSYRCDGCTIADKCLYYDFYEKVNIPHNYRFDISLNSDRFDFGLYLFGDACSEVLYVLSALEKTISKQGFGRERKVFDEFEIFLNGEEVYTKEGFVQDMVIHPHIFQPHIFDSPDVKIIFQTPLRIKRSSKLEYDTIHIEHILRSIHQRFCMIFDQKQVHSLDYHPTYLADVKAFSYSALHRRSDRQGKKLVIDGVIGEMSILGLDERSRRLLSIGQLIGVGKQTSFGLGKIKIEEVKRK